MAKQDNTNTEEEVAMEVMPGADPLTEEEKGEEFKVDLNFEEQETQEEEEVEDESETEEEPQEGTEEADEEAEDQKEQQI